jgi:hypothetical protein
MSFTLYVSAMRTIKYHTMIWVFFSLHSDPLKDNHNKKQFVSLWVKGVDIRLSWMHLPQFSFYKWHAHYCFLSKMWIWTKKCHRKERCISTTVPPLQSVLLHLFLTEAFARFIYLYLRLISKSECKKKSKK